MTTIESVKQARLAMETEVAEFAASHMDWSFSRVAAAYGVERSTISRICRKHGLPGRKTGRKLCADQWHRLAQWLEEDPGNWRKLEAWLKAMWDEHPEADRTFAAAPGLVLVWSGAKIEVREKIAESQGA